jgi:hypothetical protein
MSGSRPIDRAGSLAPSVTRTGWHPLGLSGIAAGLIGVLLIASHDMGNPSSATRPVVAAPEAPSADARLEAQRAVLQERLSRFPATDQRAAQIAAIGALAGELGLTIDSGEYRNAESPMPGELAMLDVRLPVHGAPEAMRSFVAGLQRESPWLAIDHLSIERDGNLWRGEVRGRLFLREGA